MFNDILVDCEFKRSEISTPSLGTTYKNRKELYDSGYHDQMMAGIDKCCKDPMDTETHATSIVSKGTYEVEDYGNLIVYSGQGKGKNQKRTRYNQAMINAFHLKIPLKVFRGKQKGNKYAPKSGYRYDGLYGIVKLTYELNKEGCNIYKFRMIKI
jgi:hypothetical protein